MHKALSAQAQIIGTMVLLLCLGLTNGCSAIPKADRLIDGAGIAAHLEHGLGLAMVDIPPIPTTIAFQDVVSSYSSQSLTERILIVTFDSPKAESQLTGMSRARADGRLKILKRANVVAIYQHAPTALDLTVAIQHILHDARPDLILAQPN